MTVITRLVGGYRRVFDGLSGALDSWLPGLAARFVFASVLLAYYWHSAVLKLGDGVKGLFVLSDGAYIQILPSVVEAADYDTSQIAFLPWGLIVHLGTYSEFLLPALVVLGLFTRLAALGMIGFIGVQSYVDIAFHHADAATIGAMFDRIQDAAILDQRLLWLFPLLYLVLRGPGLLSVDHWLGRRFPTAD